MTVKPTDLSTLTTQFVRGSAKYQAASPVTRLVVSALVTVASNAILGVAPSVPPTVKAKLIAAYKNGMLTLVSGGWLTSSQATTLDGLAGAI